MSYGYVVLSITACVVVLGKKKHDEFLENLRLHIWSSLSRAQ